MGQPAVAPRLKQGLMALKFHALDPCQPKSFGGNPEP
jgi:hypothetical protein